MCVKEAEILTGSSSNGSVLSSRRISNMWNPSELFQVSLNRAALIHRILTVTKDIIIPRGIENKTAIGMRLLARPSASIAKPSRHGGEAYSTEAPREIRTAQRQFMQIGGNCLGGKPIAKCAYHASNLPVCCNEHDPPRPVNRPCRFCLLF